MPYVTDSVHKKYCFAKNIPKLFSLLFVFLWLGKVELLAFSCDIGRLIPSTCVRIQNLFEHFSTDGDGTKAK